MIRIAICDDEKNIRTYLSSLVRKQNIECEITEYASTDEHLSDQKEHDLLFLDIEMKSVASGMDGMSMAKQIRATELTKQPIIIFVTGYEKYVYDAFDVTEICPSFPAGSRTDYIRSGAAEENAGYPICQYEQGYTVRSYLLSGKPEPQSCNSYE